MQSNNPNAPVLIPRSQTQSAERGTPLRVYHAVPVQQYAVQYADEVGVLHREIWYKIGDRVYQPPGSEDFSAGLRTVKDELTKQLNLLVNPLDSAAADAVKKDEEPVEV